MSIFAELKRRNVFKVAAVYVVTAWLVLQVADVILNNIGTPDWVFRVLLLLLAIGLPFAVIFAWAFELTPDGIRREVDVHAADSIAPTTGSRLNIVLATLLAAAVGFILFESFSDRSDSESDVETAASSSIAVLPLINMSAVPENEFFAGGVHEEILTNLSRIDGLRVISRTTMLRYMDSDLSVRDIAREVGARYIVEGSVRRANNHARITVQLIDAFNDAHLWARNYDRELSDIFATQSEVAAVITNSLQLEIQPENVVALDNMPTKSVKAYDLYIRARSIERSRAMTPSTLRQQRTLLEDAVAADPTFVEAWAYLKRVLDELVIDIATGVFSAAAPEERERMLADVVEARRMALAEAISLDPDNIETLLARASEDFLDPERRSEERKRFIDRALEIDPENAEAWRHLGWYLTLMGDDAGAERAFLKALELDPIHASNIFAAWMHYRSVGNEEKTAELGTRLANFAPDVEDNNVFVELPSYARLDSVAALFIETADEAVLDRYAATLEAERIDFKGGIFSEPKFVLGSHEAHLMALRNQLERLADDLPPPLPEDFSFNDLMTVLYWNHMVLSAQLATERYDDAEATAKRMLALKQAAPVKDHFYFIYVFLIVAETLGDDELMQEFQQKLRSIRVNDSALYDPFQILARSFFDLDKTVEKLLAQKRKHPNWFGTDFLAAEFLRTRRILVHPDVQAFYVNEGKWIDFLSDRVPEYAKYRD